MKVSLSVFRIFISGTFFGSITANSEDEAKKLFVELHCKFEKSDGIKDHDWVWKQVEMKVPKL